MVKKVALMAVFINFQSTYSLFTDAATIFREMDQRFDELREEMKREREAFSKISSHISQFSFNTKDVISVTQKDNLAVITLHVPGLNAIDAQVEDDVLRIQDDADKLYVLVEGELVHADVHFSFKEEKKDDKGSTIAQSYFHSAPTVALPGRVDLNHPENVKIEYVDSNLTITIPVLVKPVHKIPVQKISSPKTNPVKEEKGKQQEQNPAQTTPANKQEQSPAPAKEVV